MGKLLGFGFILSGLVIGGVGVPLSATSSSGTTRVMSVAKVSMGFEATAAEFNAEPRTILAPHAPVLLRAGAAEVPPPSQRAATPIVKVAEPRPALRPPSAPAARKPITAFETVTIPNEPAAIARALQSELARVGCYHGAVTGVWSMDSRHAMKKLTERVNAALPVDKPDFILLSLVKAQTGLVCGQSCPTGQAAAADGRCTPHAILAQATRKASPKVVVALRKETEPASAAARVLATPPPAAPVHVPNVPDTQRMALAGPKEPEVSKPPVTAADKEFHAKQARKRERKDPPAAKVTWGQTRWARDFFRSSSLF